MGEKATIFDKYGAIDFLKELLSTKECYQALTTKKAFEVMT